MTKSEIQAKRNLNPHAEARAAMWIWHEEYGRSCLGSMDFYDHLTPSEKETCKRCVDEILATRRVKTYKSVTDRMERKAP